MRNLIRLILTITTISGNSQDIKTEQKTKQYEVTYQKDGKDTTETISIQDENFQKELQRMMSELNYKSTKTRNDTIFNSKGNPILVKLDDDIFGASFQKFEYDQQDRPIKIIGYDNQYNIKPFYHDVAIKIHKYDLNGNLIEIRNLQENGKLISSAFEDTPIIVMKYNAEQKLIEEWFLDEKGNLRSEFAIIKYEYNDNGIRISTGWYNEKGEKK